MSDEKKLIESFNKSGVMAQLFTSIDSLKNVELYYLMQQTNLQESEINYCNFMVGLGSDFGISTFSDEALRIMLLNKSRDGWFLDKVSNILKEIGKNAEKDETKDTRADHIKKAFTGE